MPALSINVPFPVFQDRDGQPLDNGYVYIGTPYLDPQTNPVQVYFDDALTIPAAQPLRTINGYVSNAGTPAQLYVNGVNFSIKVLDSKANLVYSFPDGSGISPNAAGVQYDPAGVGAVSTTVQAKLRETVSVKDFGASSTNTTVQNKTALQAAITAVATAGGGTIVVPYDCDYGMKTRTPSTWPSFTGTTKPVLVIDYSQSDTQLPDVYPTSYDGMQARYWFNTPQTTSPGQHDGNYQWARADWNPGYATSNDADLTGTRTAFDNRRCGFATSVLGSVAWQFLQGTRTGSTLTNEELSNISIAKFAMPGDTLGDYTPYLVERKTGFVSYGGGRNLPSAYHHFEAPLAGTAADIGLFESSSTTSTVRIRNVNGSTSGGTVGAEDVAIKNVSGSAVINLVVGDAVKVDKTTRRVTVYKALQQAKANMTYSASMTPDADAANIHQAFCSNGTAFTINAPSGTASAGQKLTIRLSNTSGGALGAVTWAAGYKLAAWTQPANGFSRSITFFYDDATPAWIEISRTPADVPN